MLERPQVRLRTITQHLAAATHDAVVDHQSFITPLSSRRQPSAIRALTPLLKTPGMMSLGGGNPNPELFPINKLSFETTDGLSLQLTPSELQESLQYSPTSGLPALVGQLTQLQQREHKPLYKDWSLVITSGSQDALTRAIEMLCSPGDSLLVESPTYSGTLSFVTAFGLNLIPIPMDECGVVPSRLDQLLSNWSGTAKKPRVLYVVPTGSNPSGITLSHSRRVELYQVCCKHNLLILEDDPYYFLYFSSAPAPQNDSDFQRPRVSSLMSMDTQQRVLRFDSLSKILSSGMRIGFVTGPNALIRQIELHMQATILHTSGISQVMAFKLLSAWGLQGWEQHLRRVALFYARKRDLCVAAARKHLGNNLARFSVPDAGMLFALSSRSLSLDFIGSICDLQVCSCGLN
jgi:DNA-binding transcriptional MocR family regulator